VGFRQSALTHWSDAEKVPSWGLKLVTNQPDAPQLPVVHMFDVQPDKLPLSKPAFAMILSAFKYVLKSSINGKNNGMKRFISDKRNEILSNTQYGMVL
jgi:hypothetical protein